MAPTSISLRSVLAHASNFVTQFVPQFVPQPPLQLPNALFAFNGHGGTTPATTSTTPRVSQSRPVLSGSPFCPIEGPTSCHNQTTTDSCCYIHPGGRLLLTQFWDEEVHVGGAEHDWTLHGLWPDLCDGSYDQFCGMAPRFDNITAILQQRGQDELLALMNRYWIAKYGTNDHLWAHEYNKHATCINTLAPRCYGAEYEPGSEVVDYFTRAFGLFRLLDTYTALDLVGITPDEHKTYELSAIQGILEQFSGGRVILKCGGGRRHDALHEAWYVYFVKGNLQHGDFVPAGDSFKGDHGNCPRHVRYLPKKAKRHATALRWQGPD